MNKKESNRLIPARALFIPLALSLGMVGCGGGNDDLVQYVKQVRSRPTKKIPEVPEAQPFRGFEYQSGQLRDPFRQFVVESKSDESAVRPTPNRPREPLEAFVLGQLQLIGTLHPKDGDWALIRDPTGILHRVTVGNYIGQNEGRILSIDANELLLHEILPDGFGGHKEERTVFSMPEITGK